MPDGPNPGQSYRPQGGGLQPTPPAVRAKRKCVREDRGFATPCLIFKGALSGGGYGQIGKGRRLVLYVHRVMYEHAVGPIPDGMEIDHLCRQRDCCEITHLEPVTRRENALRGYPGRFRDPNRDRSEDA